MNKLVLAGILLVVLGAGALIYQGIDYTTREKAIDIGPLEITAERRRTIPLPPVVGAVAVTGGIALIAVGYRKS